MLQKQHKAKLTAFRHSGEGVDMVKAEGQNGTAQKRLDHRAGSEITGHKKYLIKWNFQTSLGKSLHFVNRCRGVSRQKPLANSFVSEYDGTNQNFPGGKSL